MSEIVNGKIRSVALEIEDHGILSASITIDGDGWTQAFGGYALDNPFEHNGQRIRVGTAWGMEWIRRVLEVLRVDRWEYLVGTPVRIDHEHSAIHRLGHFLEDRWFDPKTDSILLALRELKP